jgi:ABC-2 type transport system permease protein
MITDILTIMWKERRGLFRQKGSRLRALMTLGIPVGLFGIYIPWDAGERWVSGGPSIFASALVPLMVVLFTIPDSFAGERERHTLPSLLASRLSDRSILLGKVGFAVSCGWGLTLLIHAVALVVVNGFHGQGRILFYSPGLAAAHISFSLILAALIATAGVLVSLRAGTVQEAQQLLGAVFMLPPMLLGAVTLALSGRFPQLRPRVLLAFLGKPPGATAVAAVLLLIVAALLWLAMARFRRDRLI